MQTWVFGYGSLIWNPGFKFTRKLAASLPDWKLRFWQSSEDHRGTPQFPGRVATIVPDPGSVVWGMAYCLDGERDEILAYLDFREKGGYQRRSFELTSEEGFSFDALCYVGSQDLSSYVGPEPEFETAAIIKIAVGPSGQNIEYLRKLHNCLERAQKMEPHVQRLFHLVSG